MEGEQPGWQFKADDSVSSTVPVSGDSLMPQALESVEWTASEYIAHHKAPAWFMIVAISTILLTALVYVVTRGDIVSSAMISVVGIAFGVFGARRPRVLNYSVDNRGLVIGQKLYSYQEFKSFAVLDEGAISSILLMPLKRFMPTISIYYEPQDEHKIVDVLATYLPIEERGQDPLDRLMHRLRF